MEHLCPLNFVFCMKSQQVIYAVHNEPTSNDFIPHIIIMSCNHLPTRQEPPFNRHGNMFVSLCLNWPSLTTPPNVWQVRHIPLLQDNHKLIPSHFHYMIPLPRFGTTLFQFSIPLSYYYNIIPLLLFLSSPFNSFPIFQICWDFSKSQKSYIGAKLIEMV